MLLKLGANVNSNRIPNASWGVTPFAFAARSNTCTVDTVRFLLQNGADAARFNGPPLPWAAHGGGGREKEEKFRLLFEAGANANACDTLTGNTVLWELTAWASDALIKSILLDKNGNTPRMLAEKREPITGSTEGWPYVPDLDECVRLLLAAEIAAEQENKG